MARAKTKVVVAPSKDDLVKIMERYAECNSKIKVLTGEKEQEVQQLTDKIDGINKSFNEKAEPLKEQMQEDFEKLQAYALANQESEFSKKKSIDLINGVIGFRTDKPSVTTLRGFTQKSALAEMVSSKSRLLKRFVMVKHSLDKNEILKMRDDKKHMDALRKVGLEVSQGEQFYAEVKEEDLV